MNYYETLYIVHPALESGRLKDIILNVEKTITKMGGSSIHIDVWGKKKMAYSIKKEKYGTYVLFQFQNNTTQNENFNLELKHNPNILGFLTTSIPKDEVKMETVDLDTQLGVNKTNGNINEGVSKPLKVENIDDGISVEVQDQKGSKEEGSTSEESVVQEDSTSEESVVKEDSSEVDEESVDKETDTSKNSDDEKEGN